MPHPSNPPFHDDVEFFHKWEKCAQKDAVRFRLTHKLDETHLDELISICNWTIMTIPENVRMNNGNGSGATSYIKTAMWKQMSRYTQYLGAQKRSGSMISLDDPGNYDKQSIGELLQGPEFKPEFIRADEIKDTKQKLEFYLRDFTERERFVLLQRADGKTLDVVGKKLKLTRERVRQIEKQALAKLKKKAQSELSVS